jgi:CheY-like chemotaxis protein
MPDSTNLRRILVAEDNDNARLILTDLCRMFGYEVDAVAHGMAAVEAARETAYDVILMDCHMPVLDGFDATKMIRGAVGGRRPVIIAVTGDGGVEECLAAGMDDYLAKPVRPPLLRAALQRWLGSTRQSSPDLSART